MQHHAVASRYDPWTLSERPWFKSTKLRCMGFSVVQIDAEGNDARIGNSLRRSKGGVNTCFHPVQFDVLLPMDCFACIYKGGVDVQGRAVAGGQLLATGTGGEWNRWQNMCGLPPQHPDLSNTQTVALLHRRYRLNVQPHIVLVLNGWIFTSRIHRDVFHSFTFLLFGYVT